MIAPASDSVSRSSFNDVFVLVLSRKNDYLIMEFVRISCVKKNCKMPEQKMQSDYFSITNKHILDF